MQISFEKLSNGEVRVQFKSGENYEDFSYSKMVRKMFDEKSVENPELRGEFTDKEKASISELIEEFRTAITESSQITETEMPEFEF